MLKNEHVFFNTTCFIAGAPTGAFSRFFKNDFSFGACVRRVQ